MMTIAVFIFCMVFVFYKYKRRYNNVPFFAFVRYYTQNRIKTAQSKNNALLRRPQIKKK